MARETVFTGTRSIREGVRMAQASALSENEAIDLVKKGDKEAYQIVVKRYMKTAYFIALGFVHNGQDALDLSQDAFIKAFRKIKRFDSRRPFFPWFYKLLKNLCLDHIKKSSRMQEIPIENVQVAAEGRGDPELREILWKGIERLPMDQKEVIILRYFRQMSYREIAETIDKPIGTVMSSLYYAKKKLRVSLTPFLGLDNA